MTERLATLLREEAEVIPVPPAAPARVLAKGRVLRARRRGVRAGIAVGVAAGLVAGGAALRIGDERGVDAAQAADDFASQGAFAIGRDLYVGEQHLRWDESIKSIYYTSAGVVVRSGGSSDPDEGASTFTLVTPTGERSPVTVTLGDRVPGFEPDSSRFAYAIQDEGRLEVVVHDVVTDRELARVTVRNQPVETGWAAPPVSIDGDVVWVRTGSAWDEVNWRTGAVRPVPDTQDTYEIQNGHYAVQRGHVWEIRSTADESTVGEVDLPRGWYAFFSPDGRAMWAFPNAVRDPVSPHPLVYDVASGERHEHADLGFELGWTPDGHLLWSHGGSVSVCEPLTDACEERWTDLGTGEPRLGGRPYGS